MGIDGAKIVLELEGKTLEDDSCYNCKHIHADCYPKGPCSQQHFPIWKHFKYGPFKDALPMRPEVCKKQGSKENL